MIRATGKPNADFYIQSIALSLRYLNDRKLEEHDITNQQARLLGGIYRSLYEGVNISRKFLEDLMELKGPSVTSLLNGLKKKGFIVRCSSADDGRAMNIMVTEKGEQVLDALRNVFESTERQLLSCMTLAEQEQFMTLLQRAHDNVSQDKASRLVPTVDEQKT
ncbi:transcriptional regulator, MarR family [Alkaliphilus metalliredigens QYMF]|uniref:Transcriptional regulator, MarR family n=1 Tax=Alkaliphilus metalliredigens (strain QYMF) TaxID=293826 RepID=A6TUY7_ALKMQ|nr:MarR family transcriptional regulator [Alkaliphilus metalliredigens]ABR50005.1 transcriptional regulator, MarR family [Alkaliphilus metalliredigens QYMF]